MLEKVPAAEMRRITRIVLQQLFVVLGYLPKGCGMFFDDLWAVVFEPRDTICSRADSLGNGKAALGLADITVGVGDARGFPVPVNVAGVVKWMQVKRQIAPGGYWHALGTDSFAKLGRG